MAHWLLRQCIAALLTVQSSQIIRVTATFGVTLLTHADADFKSMLARADRALYRAKDAGRDGVVCLGFDGPAEAPRGGADRN